MASSVNPNPSPIVIPTAWAIIFWSEITVITVVGVATSEELLAVEINVGRDAKGGRVGVGRMEFKDLFVGTVIISDCRPNSVASAVGMYVTVRRVVWYCGRLRRNTDPMEELKMAEISVPPTERLRFTKASEEEVVLRKRPDA